MPNNAADIVERDLSYICSRLVEEADALAGSRLLIVGGAGFLGHYLVQTIAHWNAGHHSEAIKLTVLDNYVRGMPNWLKRVEGTPGLTLRTVDIARALPTDLGDMDYVIHAASIASPIYYRQHPIETMDANVQGVRNLLDYALERQQAGKGLKGLLFFSTSEIYGDPPPEEIPTPETFRGNVSCTGPRSCYDEAKRYGETLCVNFARQYGIPVTIARPFNNYGPGLKITDGRVVADFARDILAGRNVALLSAGTPTRTFCYIADAVIGYYKILIRGRPGEPYNIGTEEPEISMRDLAELMVRVGKELFEYRGEVVQRISDDEDYLIDNPNRRCPQIAKAREELGFAPSVGLEEGLRRSLIWYKANQQAEDR